MTIKIFLSLSLLIIVISLFFGRYKYVQSKYENDYVALENDIFLPDSEGRGFSDDVKFNIEEKFEDLEIQKMFFRYARLKRELLKSKSVDEYLLRIKNSIRINNCVIYLIESSKDTKILNNRFLVASIVQDNEKMKNFQIYLEQYKFNTKNFQDELLKILNDKTLGVSTKKSFNEKCVL